MLPTTDKSTAEEMTQFEDAIYSSEFIGTLICAYTVLGIFPIDPEVQGSQTLPDAD